MLLTPLEGLRSTEARNPLISTAAIASGVIVSGVQERLRCASLLKPFYAWVSPCHENLVYSAVALSDNEATDELIEEAGGLRAVLETIEERTGVEWDEAPTWGSVAITAGEVAQALAALMAADDERSRLVMECLGYPPEFQRFDADAEWAELTGQPLDDLGVKAGWFLSEDEPLLRTHALVTGPDYSAVVLTGVPVEDELRSDYARFLSTEPNDEGVLDVHWRLGAPVLHWGLEQAAALLPSA